ncbi:hypothetical protein PUR61_25670, partial [Streptomyces sp. BE20]|uniref:hypothetical protein n=1 Tax=Streptomyces sp. BE20 TaxID=3002525 RepID=UPI002E78CAD4
WWGGVCLLLGGCVFFGFLGWVCGGCLFFFLGLSVVGGGGGVGGGGCFLGCVGGLCGLVCFVLLRAWFVR